jgi:hypothetical protein
MGMRLRASCNYVFLLLKACRNPDNQYIEALVDDGGHRGFIEAGQAITKGGLNPASLNYNEVSVQT